MYYCLWCVVTFGHPRHLQRHCRRAHESHPDYNIDLVRQVCSRTAEGRQMMETEGLAEHKKTKQRKQICTECGKMFQRPKDLRSHKKVHTQERPWRCDEDGCGKTFKKIQYLKAHKETHSSQRVFCDVCGNSYASRNCLYIHRKLHSSDNQPYRCDLCGKDFNKSSNLSKHKREVHSYASPYRCDLCGKDFKRSSNLSMHKRNMH